MIAGVLFNFILAIIIYAGIAFAWGDKYIQFSDAEYGMQFGCESAKTLGFRDGDILVSADGKTLDAADFGVATQELLEAREVTVKRNGALTTIDLPKNALLTVSNELRDHKDRGFMTYRFPVVVKNIVAGQPAAAAGLKAGDRIVGIDSVRTETCRFRLSMADMRCLSSLRCLQARNRVRKCLNTPQWWVLACSLCCCFTPTAMIFTDSLSNRLERDGLQENHAEKRQGGIVEAFPSVGVLRSDCQDGQRY